MYHVFSNTNSFFLTESGDCLKAGQYTDLRYLVNLSINLPPTYLVIESMR